MSRRPLPEKIKYRPMAIRKALTEMKDLSEIMIDLAYSAALLHSHELAEEVLELEERVDTLSYILTMNAMLAARDAEDAEALVAITTIAGAADQISDAAADVADHIVLQGAGVHPIVREAVAKMEERLTRTKVNPDSVDINNSLEELELASKIGVDIIAIRREKRWIINPKKNETIIEGDILIVRGAPLGVKKLEGLATGTVTT